MQSGMAPPHGLALSSFRSNKDSINFLFLGENLGSTGTSGTSTDDGNLVLHGQGGRRSGGSVANRLVGCKGRSRSESGKGKSELHLCIVEERLLTRCTADEKVGEEEERLGLSMVQRRNAIFDTGLSAHKYSD